MSHLTSDHPFFQGGKAKKFLIKNVFHLKWIFLNNEINAIYLC